MNNQPSQTYLDIHEVELTGEYRIPVLGDTIPNYDKINGSMREQYSPWTLHTNKVPDNLYQGPRWILRKKTVAARPSQTELDKHNVDIVAGPLPWAEAKKTWPDSKACWCHPRTETWWFTTLELRYCGDSVNPVYTYIVSPRALKVKPWTLDTVPLPLVVKRKSDMAIFTISAAVEEGITIVGKFSTGLPVGVMHPASIVSHTWEMLLENFTQRDGSPCGEIVK